MDKLYEIIDSSDEEMYYTIGLFLSLDEAIDKVRDVGVGMFDNLDEVAVCHIKEREIGKINWSGVGKNVYECQWVQNFDTDRWELTLILDSRPSRDKCQVGKDGCNMTCTCDCEGYIPTATKSRNKSGSHAR